MDAITMNGEGLNGGMLNFSEPQFGFNFTNPPDFSANEFWEVPDQLPENPQTAIWVHYFGITIPENDPNTPLLIKTSDLPPEGLTTQNGVAINDVSILPYLYVINEANILTNGFNLPENIWNGIPAPANGLTPVQYQNLLYNFFDNAYRQLAYDTFYGVYESFGEGGAIVIDPNASAWDFLPFTIVDGELVFNPQNILPWNLPVEFYGPGDAYRLMKFMNDAHDYLSAAYGTRQNLGMFPDRPSGIEKFFQRVWSGLKKFFPGLVIARNAFLGLTALNLFGVADKMQSYNDQTALKKTWEGFGGSWNALQNAIEDGAGLNGLGEVGTAAALIAAATPILLSILKMVSDDAAEISEDILNIVNTDLEVCGEYVQSMTEFIASYGLENIPTGQWNEIFAIQFPEIPEECIGPVQDFFEDSLDLDLDFLPGGEGDNETDSGADPDPGTLTPETDETDENGKIPGNLLILGAITAIFVLK